MSNVFNAYDATLDKDCRRASVVTPVLKHLQLNHGSYTAAVWIIKTSM